MKNIQKLLIVYIIALSAFLLFAMRPNVYATPFVNLIKAIENGDLEAAQIALRNGADVNKMWFESPYQTPLMIAASEGKKELAKLLVQHGAEVNTKDHLGDTALMWAANGDHLNVVEFLVEHGANVNAATTGPISPGSTALMYASQKGYVNLVKYLIKHGAKINAKNTNGDTALSIAEKNGHMEIARILREMR